MNSKQLQIAYNDFIATGGQYQSYTFSVSVWVAASADTANAVSTSITVTWININIPQFSIAVRNGKMYATRDNYVDITLSNYPIGSTDIITTWTLTPTQFVNTSLVSLSSGNTTLQMLAGTFNQNTSYSLTVSIYNKNYIETMQNQTLNFTTGVAPSGGVVVATPSNGTFLVTVFNISIANWTSKNLPIQYYVYGSSSIITGLIDLSKKYLY